MTTKTTTRAPTGVRHRRGRWGRRGWRRCSGSSRGRMSKRSDSRCDSGASRARGGKTTEFNRTATRTWTRVWEAWAVGDVVVAIDAEVLSGWHRGRREGDWGCWASERREQREHIQHVSTCRCRHCAEGAIKRRADPTRKRVQKAREDADDVIVLVQDLELPQILQ